MARKEKTMRIGNSGLSAALAAGWLLALAVPGASAVEGPASGKDQPTVQALTADEHLARAAAYKEKASAYREEVAVHRKMLADFERQQGNPPLRSKLGRELPWMAEMRKHCEGYIKDAERLAADADRFGE